MSQFLLGFGMGAALTFAYTSKSLNPFQWMYDNETYSDLEKVRRHVYELKYWHKGIRYTIRIIIRPGPKGIVSVSNEASKEVYDNLITYMGPNRDFHGQKITPKDLGYEMLQFITMDGKEYNFESNEVITIP